MVFIGGIFFQAPNVTTVSERQILSRSLDACQTLSALDRGKTVKFRVVENGDDEKGQIYALVLEQCFPGFRPTCLEDFYNIQMPKKSKLFSICSSDSTKNTTKDATHSVSFDLTPKFEDNTLGSPNSSEISNFGTTNLTSALSATNLLSGSGDKLSASLKNRGRRVSFGAIRAIPTNFISDGNIMAETSNSATSCHLTPLVLAEMGRDDEESSNLFKNALEKKTEDESILVDNATDEYVTQMLQKTIDEVLVID